MYDLLKDMRIVEGSAFVAAPLCGLTLAQFGAEVIRFDGIGGGPDYYRWPLAESGKSLYWMGLNKGKKSIAIDLRRPEGCELASDLVTAPGEAGGYFVTNFPVDGFLSYEELVKKRADLVSIRVMGNPDGRTAVDYTVNCAVGYPYMTGAVEAAAPVNHVLPAWDLVTGTSAAFALLAGARRRSETGKGAEHRISLSDIAFAMTANLGMLAEAALGGGDRPRYGNAIYGAFGRDFETADGRRVMIVAITQRQWALLVRAAGIGETVASLEQSLGVNFDEEGARFVHRLRLEPLVEGWAKSLTYRTLAERLDAGGVCWGPYQTIGEALAGDPRCSSKNPMFQSLAHPGVAAHLTPGSPVDIRGEQRLPVLPAPMLGQHTDEILSEVMGLSSGEIARLHDAGLVAGPEAA